MGSGLQNCGVDPGFADTPGAREAQPRAADPRICRSAGLPPITLRGTGDRTLRIPKMTNEVKLLERLLLVLLTFGVVSFVTICIAGALGATWVRFGSVETVLMIGFGCNVVLGVWAFGRCMTDPSLSRKEHTRWEILLFVGWGVTGFAYLRRRLWAGTNSPIRRVDWR